MANYTYKFATANVYAEVSYLESLVPVVKWYLVENYHLDPTPNFQLSSNFTGIGHRYLFPQLVRALKMF